MIRIATLLWVSLFGVAQLAQGQQRQVCITIDDLPCTNCPEQQAPAINRKLLQTLQLNKVPAIGFVNEGKLYTHARPDPAKVAILRQWLDQGFELGNHTYSHIEIDRATVAEYEQDLMKGERISRPLMARYGKKLRYFRHPQLRTGPTAAYKQQLDSVLSRHGYITAPITIDNDDYIYAYCYAKASQRKDSLAMQQIAGAYLSYMQQIIAHFERVSQESLGYEVKQTLLLHASQLNADHLQPLLDLFTRRGYRFVSLTEALTDPAYSLPQAPSPRGISWLERWMLVRGKVPESQPAVSDDIMARFRVDQAAR